MTKKNYLFIGIALLIIAAGAFIFTKYFGSSYTAKTSFHAVSSRTSSFVYIKNIAVLKYKIDSAQYTNTLATSNSLNVFFEHIAFTDSVLKQIETALEISVENIIAQPNNVGSAKIGFLTIAEFNKSVAEKKILSLVKKLGFETSDYNYQGYTIYSIAKFANGNDFSFTVYNNLWIASFSTPQIEEALSTLKENNGKNANQLFDNFSKKVNFESDFVVFTDNNGSSNISQLIFSPAFLEQQKDKPKSADWSAYAFSLNENNITFEGNYKSENFAETSFSNISSENAGFEILSFLPNNTAYFELYSSKNNINFQNNEPSYPFFKTWLNEEAAFFVLETFDEDYQKRAGLILKASSLDSAKVNLYKLNIEMAPVQDYDGLAIYEMNVDVLSKIVHSNLISVKKPFFAFLKDYVVFANDVNVVKTIIEKYNSKAFLSKNLNLETDIEARAGKVVYLNPQLLNAPLVSIFNTDEFPQSMGKILINYTSENGEISSKGSLSFDQDIRKKSVNIWNVELDTLATFKPQIVVNEETKRNEIFVQDLKNTIYIFSQSGDVILKKSFLEPILSNVYQIDIYKANKLVYVFNTKNKIYALKKDGSIVDGYPIKLPDEASNKLLVVNYDNDRNYRFFIACKNNKVYGYETNGKPLAGWSPLGEPGRVVSQLNYALFGGKDYIYFNTEAGTFYALDRKGQNRFDQIPLDAPFQSGFESTKDGFVGLSNGSVYNIDLKGKATVKILGDSSYNTFTNFLEKEAFAVANQNEIRIAKSKWTLLGKKVLNDEIVSIEKLNLNNKTWFLVNCQNSIYLINEMGEIHRDFPVLANSEAQIQSFFEEKDNLLFFLEGKKLKVFELVLPN